MQSEKYTNGCPCKAETDPRIRRIVWWLPEREGGGDKLWEQTRGSGERSGGYQRREGRGDKLWAWNKQIQTTLYKINNKDLLYSTGNYTQYLVMICESESVSHSVVSNSL